MILSKLSFYHKILILSIIVFANSMIKGYAQQQVVDSLNRTIQMLEDQQKLLRDELDIHSRQTKEAIDINEKKYENMFNKQKNDLENKNFTVIMLLSFFSGIGIITIILSVSNFLKSIVIQKVSQEVSKQTKNLVEDNRNVIADIIKTESIDRKVKENFGLVVLHGGTYNKAIMELLEQFNYSTPDIRHLNKEDFKEYSKYDVFIIDNTNNEFGYEDRASKPPEILQDLLSSFKEKAFFYYNETQNQHPKDHSTPLNFSFANSLPTFNNNFLDLLRYKYLVSDS